MKVLLVAGCRPNFMKIAPIYGEIQRYNATAQQRNNAIAPIIVHTGQHYDFEMSEVFFNDLELPEPDLYLGVGSGTHAEQAAKVTVEFEKVLAKEEPDIVVVVGDVNSTLACALATAKYRCTISHVPSTLPFADRPIICHIEAGLRSYDLKMPEEINRRLTDHLSDVLFTPTKDANNVLKKEGVNKDKIFMVGNVMVDALRLYKNKINRSKITDRLNLKRKTYAVVTLHRAENVDDPLIFKRIWQGIKAVSDHIPIVFPAHPRVKKRIKTAGMKIKTIKPLGYCDFIKLIKNSHFVMTDSGGIQAEATYLNIPCLTLRDNTEWLVTIKYGANRLVGTLPNDILEASLKIIERGSIKKRKKIPLWDGRTAKRIVRILKRFL